MSTKSQDLTSVSHYISIHSFITINFFHKCGTTSMTIKNEFIYFQDTGIPLIPVLCISLSHIIKFSSFIEKFGKVRTFYILAVPPPLQRRLSLAVLFASVLSGNHILSWQEFCMGGQVCSPEMIKASTIFHRCHYSFGCKSQETKSRRL